MLNNAMRSGTNPQAFLSQIIGKSSPEQIQSVIGQAQAYGVPNSVLSQIQNLR